MTDLESSFLAILSRHKGLSRAISVADMAEALGFGRAKTGQRQAQTIKRSLIEQGHFIGSSCGKVSGYYMIDEPAEVKSTMRQYQHRFVSLACLLKSAKAALRKQEEPPQLELSL